MALFFGCVPFFPPPRPPLVPLLQAQLCWDSLCLGVASPLGFSLADPGFFRFFFLFDHLSPSISRYARFSSCWLLIWRPPPNSKRRHQLRPCTAVAHLMYLCPESHERKCAQHFEAKTISLQLFPPCHTPPLLASINWAPLCLEAEALPFHFVFAQLVGASRDIPRRTIFQEFSFLPVLPAIIQSRLFQCQAPTLWQLTSLSRAPE